MDLSHLQRPVFIIDRRKAMHNIEVMAKKAKLCGVRLRPHVKTHQSAAVASWLRDFGVKSLTVSSFDMADYFVRAGWEDVMMAVPVNINQIPAADALASRCSLHIIVDSVFAAEKLADGIGHSLHVWIETDTGYHRTGVPVENTTLMVEIACVVRQSRFLKLEGILVHDGHTYSATGPEEVRKIFGKSYALLRGALEALKAHGFPGLELSIGDTPTCSVLDVFPAPINEIRPGTFFFYDLTQAATGACQINDIAAAVACPVISKHPERGEVILYGGSVHISKEPIKDRDGSSIYGRISRLNDSQTVWNDKLEDASVISLSQEHGILRGSLEFVDSVNIGETLVILPVHVCTTANLHREFYVLGEGAISKFLL
jgi:D-serine deaminase-like pyridoxal phosphate-dependent protein